MTIDVKKDLPVHQPWLVKRHRAIAVGVKTQMVDGLKFHQWNTTTGLFVHHADGKPGGRRRLCLAKRSQSQADQQREKNGVSGEHRGRVEVQA